MSIRVQWDETAADTLWMIFEEDWNLQSYAHALAAVEMMTAGYVGYTLVMDLSHAARFMPHQATSARHLNDSTALCDAAQVILVQPGHFQPQVSCTTVTVATRAELAALLAKVPA
jgi:hypothetical protein